MFRLETEFYKLPLRFDSERLREEVSQFTEPEWRAHPQGHVDNSALPLVTVGGGMNDEVKGPMRPTPFLARCPYIQQVLASLGSPIGRARLMRIAGQSDAHAHVDTNYYWMHHIRVHIPALTYPQVEFMCNDKTVHMAAGESWIFDSWKLHNVLNPVNSPRIHLVADTVGSARFWDLVERGARPFDPAKSEAQGIVEIPYQADLTTRLEFEEENFPIVMSPWEQAALAARMMEDVRDKNSEVFRKLSRRLERLHQGWHALWARYGNSLGENESMTVFRKAMDEFDAELPGIAGDASLANGVSVVEALRQAIVRSAVNPEVLEARAKKSPAVSPAPAAVPAVAPSRFDRPVFIVAAPRSGSSMLFELLSHSADFWTIGGESHLLFENIATLDPAKRGWDSNRLTAADADEQTVSALHEAFSKSLRDYAGQPLREHNATIRLLEKTPKNSLRIPFLAAAFPEARFIFLYREPAENISSILEAWRSGRFVMYPQLPGWSGAQPWSMMLPPGWRELIGKPLAEVAARQWLSANEHILGDLAAIPKERWCAISYADVVRYPQSAAERLCGFAGVRWQQTLPGPLPHSRYTLTPPAPEKWRKNESELAPVLPLAEPVSMRVRDILKDHAPPFPDKKIVTPDHPVPASPVTFDSQHTKSFPELLEALGVSLVVSTYQAGKLIFIRSQDGVLNTHFRDFASPMGIAYDPTAGRLAIGTRHEVWQFRNFPDLSAKVEPPNAHDAVFVPACRLSTGDIRIHEIAWIENELWAVNTRFSCLCTFDGLHSFVPRWRPPFITALTADDRCHLNGLAVVENNAAYVTCHGAGNTPDGWRADKAHGGCLIEVHSGEIVTAGLAMPHSPRFYAGRLWLLESGHGRISTVDLDTGKTETFAELPGFTRGLDFFGDFAFVGLSQVRETAVFSGIPISEPGRERNCGVWVLDIRTGKTVAFLQFTGTVQEVFALHILPGIRFPELLNEDSELLAGAFLVPEEALAPAASAGKPALAVV